MSENADGVKIATANVTADKRAYLESFPQKEFRRSVNFTCDASGKMKRKRKLQREGETGWSRENRRRKEWSREYVSSARSRRRNYEGDAAAAMIFATCCRSYISLSHHGLITPKKVAAGRADAGELSDSRLELSVETAIDPWDRQSTANQ